MERSKRNTSGFQISIFGLMVLGVLYTYSAHAKGPEIRKPLNWGLGSFTQVFGINALDAWQLSRGSRAIKVAIIDTGADYTHPDLIPNLWRNPGETGLDSQGRLKNSNGLDDDGNGFVDDEIGWNFVDLDNKPFDSHGHGTHIAGIIGATGLNRIHGVSPQVSLMILKYYDPKASGEQNLMNTVRAIDYAVDNGAHIINYSAGGPSFSMLEYQAIKRAQSKGILFVSAAGNERQNADINHYFPASYDLDNILAVTAIDSAGNMLPTSNFGPKSVDIAAPGKNILSTSPGNKVTTMSGTSQATAFVTGMSVLVSSLLPRSTATHYSTLRTVILESGRVLSSLQQRTLTGKVADAAKAVNLAKKTETLRAVTENTSSDLGKKVLKIQGVGTSR